MLDASKGSATYVVGGDVPSIVNSLRLLMEKIMKTAIEKKIGMEKGRDGVAHGR